VKKGERTKVVRSFTKYSEAKGLIVATVTESNFGGKTTNYNRNICKL